MYNKKKGCLIWCAVVLGVFWIIGFIGNHSDWIGAKWVSVSGSIASARSKVAAGCAERKRKWQEEREEEERRQKIKFEEMRREEECRRMEAARLAALKRKEELLRDFAIRESPVLWESITQLKESIKVQVDRERILNAALREVGREPDRDDDYCNLIRERHMLEKELSEVMERLCDAYVTARKYDAMIGAAERAELKRMLTSDGADEADAAVARYDKMRREK